MLRLLTAFLVVAVVSGQTYQLKANCDDHLTVYADGMPLANSNGLSDDWTSIQEFDIPQDTVVLSVKCYNAGGPHGLAMQLIENGAVSYQTSAGVGIFTCTANTPQSIYWNNVGYVGNPDGFTDPIDTPYGYGGWPNDLKNQGADWIWGVGSGNTVYCRTELPIDVDCKCKNGGTCVRYDNAQDKCKESCKWKYVNYLCKCPEGWTGPHCGKPKGPAPTVCNSDADCQNGGTCIFGRCNCPAPWGGQYCEITEKRCCDPNPCMKNGVCQEAQNARGFICTCAHPEIRGKKCGKDKRDRDDTNPCVKDCCKWGVCNPDPDEKLGFRCDCYPGYKGALCHRKNTTYVSSCQDW